MFEKAILFLSSHLQRPSLFSVNEVGQADKIYSHDKNILQEQRCYNGV